MIQFLPKEKTVYIYIYIFVLCNIFDVSQHTTSYQEYRNILASNRAIKPCTDCNADGLVYHNQSRLSWISKFSG